MAMARGVAVRALSDLARLAGVSPRRRGGKRGYCMICWRYTEEGMEPGRIFKDTFTEYNKIMRFGDVVCPYCAAILETQDYRRRSWVMARDGVRFLKGKDEIADVLTEPPEPPFFIYLTMTGKKHGWIALAWTVAFSRDRYPVSVDGEVVWIDRKTLREYLARARELRGAGAAKTELMAGCRPRTWGRARELCRWLETVRGDRLWHLAVWLV